MILPVAVIGRLSARTTRRELVDRLRNGGF